ncbi:MAG: glycosyltransferase, partial [Pyrinomonadaceae bacterium]
MLVYVFASLFPKRVNRAAYEPQVSIIITAHNEERDIGQKLDNTLSIDYPFEKLEIMVASDCSNDNTDAIVREFEVRNVKLFRQAERKGKTSAQNDAVE